MGGIADGGGDVVTGASGIPALTPSLVSEADEDTEGGMELDSAGSVEGVAAALSEPARAWFAVGAALAGGGLDFAGGLLTGAAIFPSAADGAVAGGCVPGLPLGGARRAVAGFCFPDSLSESDHYVKRGRGKSGKC